MTRRMDTRVSAAVLIGGQSRRMGEPKALLRLDPEGPTLLERAVMAVRGVTDDVFLVGRPAWALPPSLADQRIVADAGQGAADGLIAALGAAMQGLCLVVACDMPFLDSSLLEQMIATARRADRSVIARDATGLHPLLAVYRTADRGRIAAEVGAGRRALMEIAEAIGAIAFEVDDDRGWSVFNVNTPDDLALARAHAAGMRARGSTHR